MFIIVGFSILCYKKQQELSVLSVCYCVRVMLICNNLSSQQYKLYNYTQYIYTKVVVNYDNVEQLESELMS